MRVIYTVANKEVVMDRDAYVMARSAGNLINIVL
jgi:hypothetical protein